MDNLDPFSLGFNAFRAGKSEDDNPYFDLKTGTEDYWMRLDWIKGFRSAERIWLDMERVDR